MERLSKVSESGFREFYKREMGFSSPRTFSRHISASQTLVERFGLYGKLIGHEGCVNTIEFNSLGDHLVSGSDDRQIRVWEWATKTLKFSYPSGHVDNVFQARIMPFTDDRKIVTSAADGKVRLGEVLENGHVETKRLGKHQGRVHKLAVEPGNPYILYSCGEDGLVQHFDLRSNSATKLFYCSAFTENQQASNSITLNAIVIDPRNPNFFAVGGSDEYARVYDIRKYQLDSSSNVDSPINSYCPRHLLQTNDVHITSMAYSSMSELLVSYSDELIYLFQKNMGLGPSPLSTTPEYLRNLEEAQVYLGHRNCKTVKGVNFFGPNDDYVLSGSDCGHIFVWKKKGAKLVRMMIGDKHIVNQLEPNPQLPVIATSGLEKSIKLWGPTSNYTVPLPHDVEEIMELIGKAERTVRVLHLLLMSSCMSCVCIEGKHWLTPKEGRTERISRVMKRTAERLMFWDFLIVSWRRVKTGIPINVTLARVDILEKQPNSTRRHFLSPWKHLASQIDCLQAIASFVWRSG